jgi:hypothetical protein
MIKAHATGYWTRLMNRCKALQTQRAFCLLILSACVHFSGADFALGQSDQVIVEERKSPIDFQNDVLPIFQKHCHSCHGPERQESNFRLDVKSRALGSADFGDPPIVAGDSKQSPLMEFVSGKDPDLLMPPEGESNPLNQKQVETLRKWIDQGAPWPDVLAGEDQLNLTTDHWSFQPIRETDPPPVPDELAKVFPLSNGIDHFIGRRLAINGLSPSSPADRVSLIRRIYLVMHGLQPTPEQVEEFVEDKSSNAYSKLVESVLSSHHYGERWARHWLDVVRFGESTGYEVNRDRPNAYHFRDYVIDALNDDKSYRDFIIEQLAGDAVGVDEGTGFLVGGPNDIVKSPDVNLTLMQREDELADYVNTTSTTFLGLTVGCARCHNHKFDPILQRDYYSLQAVFAGVQHGERKLKNRLSAEDQEKLARARKRLKRQTAKLAELRQAAPQSKITPNLLPSVNARLNTDSFTAVTAKFVRFEIRQTTSAEPCIDEMEIFAANTDNNVAIASRAADVTSSGDYPNNPKHKLKHINDGKYGNDFSWISNSAGKGWIQIELPKPVEIDRVTWARDRTGVYADRLAVDYAISVSTDGKQWNEVSGSSLRRPYANQGQESEDAFIKRLPEPEAKQAKLVYSDLIRLREEIKQLEQAIPIGYVGNFRKPNTIRRLFRGDPMSPREEVAPDTLTVMGSLELTNDSPEQERRLKLAQWIASDDNPLAARVIVNRVWHYHFGQGIVGTPSDFGKNGAAPTHPELLDYLAHRFMENGWSLKWLHREILMSSTFRQSSRPRSEAIAKDADSRLLWRFPPRRLEAEAIRDCVLQLSGKLNPETGGPGFLLFRIDHENVHHYFPLEKFEPQHFRRMIYMMKIRQEQDEVFGVFDCPDGGQTIPDRSRSTTALQALNLLNSRFMLEQADYLAQRLRAESGENVADQIKLAFDYAFSRSPSQSELEDSIEFVRQHGLEAFCRAIFNTNEFLFVS